MPNDTLTAEDMAALVKIVSEMDERIRTLSERVASLEAELRGEESGDDASRLAQQLKNAQSKWMTLGG